MNEKTRQSYFLRDQLRKYLRNILLLIISKYLLCKKLNKYLVKKSKLFISIMLIY